MGTRTPVGKYLPEVQRYSPEFVSRKLAMPLGRYSAVSPGTFVVSTAHVPPDDDWASVILPTETTPRACEIVSQEFA